MIRVNLNFSALAALRNGGRFLLLFCIMNIPKTSFIWGGCFLIWIFLSEGNVFQQFAPRVDSFYNNAKLILLHNSTDSGLGFLFTLLSGMFAYSHYKARHKGIYLLVYLGRVAVLFGALGIYFWVVFLSTFHNFPWISGILKLVFLVYVLYFVNEVIKDRNRFSNIEDPKEIVRLWEQAAEYFKSEKNGHSSSDPGKGA